MPRSSQKLTLKIGGEMVILALQMVNGKTYGENEIVILFYSLFTIVKVGFFMFISLFCPVNPKY
jgi:hypothetical protein